jgi:hypothetical protein
MTAGKTFNLIIILDDVLSIYNPNPIRLPYYTPKELEINETSKTL